MKIDYSDIKRKLESCRCREHGKSPKVTVAGDKLSIDCCCDKFRTELTKKAGDLIAEETKKAIMSAFK